MFQATFVVLCLFVITVGAEANERPIVSVLDFGATPIAKLAADTLRNRFRSTGELLVADPDLVVRPRKELDTPVHSIFR